VKPDHRPAIDCPRGTSCGRHNGVVGQTSCVKQCGLYVSRLEETVVSNNFLVRCTGSEQFKQIHHAKTCPANAGTTAALVGVYCNAIKDLHIWILSVRNRRFQQKEHSPSGAKAQVG